VVGNFQSEMRPSSREEGYFTRGLNRVSSEERLRKQLGYGSGRVTSAKRKVAGVSRGIGDLGGLGQENMRLRE
jgi:hypothetical protein